MVQVYGIVGSKHFQTVVLFSVHVYCLMAKSILVNEHLHCMKPDSWPNRKLLALYNEHQLADYENDH